MSTTTGTTTRTTTRTTSDELNAALDGLAAAAGHACDEPRTRAVLAVVVQRLEDATGAWLGDTDGDPLVVLQRRFGRAHARLAEQRPDHVDADLLTGLARALQPQPAPAQRGGLRPTAAAALAGC